MTDDRALGSAALRFADSVICTTQRRQCFGSDQRIALVSAAAARGDAVREDAGSAFGGLAPRIFERFVQGEQPLQRASGGLGLGLAIAKNLVELHGGTIAVESAGVGKGARFTVILPIVEAATAVPAPPTPVANSRLAAPTCLLVVDDTDAGSPRRSSRPEGH